MIDPLVIMRTLHFAACTLAVGTVAFAMLARVAPLDRRFRALTAAALAVAVVTGAGWLLLIARNILDAPLSEVVRQGGLADVALDTQFGRVACLRLVLAVIAMALLAARPLWPALAATVALIASIAFSGHAGAGTGLTGLIHVLADMAHLATAGFWLGALPALVWMLLWSRGASERGVLAVAATRRFSTLAAAAVAALAVSGLVNVAVLTGLPFDPFGTPYGRALALKIALFASMLGLAGLNRFWLTPALPDRQALNRLVLTVLGESALGLGILLLAGVLGTLPPAAHLHSSAPAINSDAEKNMPQHVHSTP